MSCSFEEMVQVYMFGWEKGNTVPLRTREEAVELATAAAEAIDRRNHPAIKITGPRE